jgi:exopolysaccharide biosynthesis polyprenyl glycosylphosphotransferase
MHEAKVEEYAGVSMLDLRAPAISDYQRMTKRGFDIFVSILLLPLLIPVMVLISLLIKIFDPGPILFNKVRAGENGARFTMFKFRTMVVGADKMKSPTDADHKQASDPRITAVGRLLRKTSLDELPQIFNVLKGEMSLVGPRPELLELVEKYESWQRTRFAVPPGITGWWQVNGRSDRPMHLHTEDDLYYIKHYSIWLDLQILVRTAWVVIVGRGAY